MRRFTAQLQRLEAAYPLRKFTPEGRLVGSIGEVIAAEALSLRLHPASYPSHDAFDDNGNVQITMTGGKSISIYSTCDRLVVLRVVSPEEAEIVYDGVGEVAWEQASAVGKNGQRGISIKRLVEIANKPPNATEPAYSEARIVSRKE